MAERLIIRINDHSTENVEWLICDENNNLISGPHETLWKEIGEEAHQYQTLVIVPGIYLRISQTKIPRTSYANLIKAIPYALEDQLADGQNTHFVILDNQGDNQIIGIIDKTQINSWLKQLSDVGINPEWMIPDFYALPESATSWIAVCDNEFVLCSCGHNLKFATDKANFFNVIKLYLESEQYAKPNHIEIMCEDVKSLHFPENAVSINGVPIHVTKPQVPIFKYLVQHLPKSSAINLLQGEYQPQHTKTLIKRTWRMAGIAVFVWLVTLLSKDLVQYYRLAKQSHATQARVEQLYHEIFPTATEIVAPRVRFERELSSLRATTEGSLALSLLAQAAPPLKKAKAITIENLQFKDEQLTLKISSNNFQNIEDLVAALKQNNLIVNQREATRSDNLASIYIVIRKSL